MIKARFGERLDEAIQRLFPFFFHRRVSPNALSLAGVAISLAGAAAFAHGSFPLGGVLVLLGGFFDAMDGAVARHQGRSTRFGAFLDSTLDRLVDMALLLGILMHYAQSGAWGTAWLAGVALVATVLVSYAKARAESIVPDFKGGILERAERLLILVAGALVGLMPIALALVAVGSTITVGQRVAIAHRRMAGRDATS